MSGPNKTTSYGADGRQDLLMFNPDAVTLVTEESHPLYDERVHLPVDEALVRSIMVRGVLTPIMVRKNGEKNGQPIVEAVDGRQRVKAAREANKRLVAEGKMPIRIPAVTKRGEDKDMAGIMLTTNELRKGDNAMVKARKLARLRDMGYGDEELAVTAGISPQTVNNLLSLLDLSPSLQKEVETGVLAASIAKDLAILPREEQDKKWKEMLANGMTKGAEAVETVKRARGKATGRGHKENRLGKRFLTKFHDGLKSSTAQEAKLVQMVIAFLLGQGELKGTLGKIAEKATKTGDSEPAEETQPSAEA